MFASNTTPILIAWSTQCKAVLARDTFGLLQEFPSSIAAKNFLRQRDKFSLDFFRRSLLIIDASHLLYRIPENLASSRILQKEVSGLSGYSYISLSSVFLKERGGFTIQTALFQEILKSAIANQADAPLVHFVVANLSLVSGASIVGLLK